MPFRPGGMRAGQSVGGRVRRGRMGDMPEPETVAVMVAMWRCSPPCGVRVGQRREVLVRHRAAARPAIAGSLPRRVSVTLI